MGTGAPELPSHLCSECSTPEQRFPEGMAEQVRLKRGKNTVADGFHCAKWKQPAGRFLLFRKETGQDAAPVGTLPGPLEHLATRCCCIPCERRGHSAQGRELCWHQGEPPASGKDRVNKAPHQRLKLHSTKNTLHSGKSCFSWSSCCKPHGSLCKPHQALSLSRVVCQHSRNHSGQAAGTECCCAGQPCVSRELST